jgi:regulator of protease activity HflC (stomatin/prohibitin superfamily)
MIARSPSTDPLARFSPVLWVAVAFLVLSGLLFVLLVVIAPEADRWPNVLLGLVLIIGAAVVTILVLASQVGNEFKDVPAGWGAVVKHHGDFFRAIDVDHQRIRRVRYNSRQNESVELFDVRDRNVDVPHTCTTLDDDKVAMSLSAIWSITDLRTYLTKVKTPEEVLDRAVRAAAVQEICLHKTDGLMGSLTGISSRVCNAARRDLRRYGIEVSAIHITGVEIIPKLAKPEEKGAKKP